MISNRKLSISTGCGNLDKLLNGGLPRGQLTLIFGESKSGKTCLSIQFAVSAAKKGLKSMFIDTDRTFYPDRFFQIAQQNSNLVSRLIFISRPNNFYEQSILIEKLEFFSLQTRIDMVIIDTITSLYGFEGKNIFLLNRELNRQLANLIQTIKDKDIVAVITSQVHNLILKGSVETEPIATRVLKFWSDNIIRLKTTQILNVREAKFEKINGKICEGNKFYFKIVEPGIMC